MIQGYTPPAELARMRNLALIVGVVFTLLMIVGALLRIVRPRIYSDDRAILFLGGLVLAVAGIASPIGHFGLPPELGRMPLILRFGSWVGGDMDGNSDVHAKAIRESLHRQHQRIISAYFQECRALADRLSQSAGRVGTSAEIEARIAEYDILVPRAREATSTRHDRMPYRIFLALVAERPRLLQNARQVAAPGRAECEHTSRARSSIG